MEQLFAEAEVAKRDTVSVKMDVELAHIVKMAASSYNEHVIDYLLRILKPIAMKDAETQTAKVIKAAGEGEKKPLAPKKKGKPKT